jgi:hypothetical protein
MPVTHAKFVACNVSKEDSVFSSQLTVRRLLGAALTAVLAGVVPCAAQVTPAAGYTPPDDTPSIRIGATIFADFTVQQQPKITDPVDKTQVTLSQFQITRSYINVTGNISHSIAFRITPDITRETGVGSSLNGSYTFRLKYAYLQWNLDDHMTRGSWARFGQQQTPYIDFMEGIYRYRFQGQIFEEREGFLSSSDVGASFHYNFAGNYGDVHAGVYNGETYTKPELNDQKGWMLRGTVRPLPMAAVLRGLRVTGFIDHDMFAKSDDRRRGIMSVSFEHPYVNAAFDYLWTKDQANATVAAIDGHGWTVWLTPKTKFGLEGLLRFDHFDPNKSAPAQERQRTIGGVAYWFPHQGSVSTALLFDVDNATFDGFSPAQPTQRRIALHALLNF